MSFGNTLKYLIFKKPPISVPASGRESKATENPYLTARRTWNEQGTASAANRQMWQLLGTLSLLICLASVAGVIYIGSQSKYVPYIVEVDKLGQTLAVAPAQLGAVANARVMHASIASFIADLRMVSADIALQRKAIYRAYSMLAPSDAATNKTNEWLNGSEESNPFVRAEKETVNIEIESVIPQTLETWQVDWIESTRDRQGTVKEQPFRMRALVTVYNIPPTPQTTEQQIRNNPLGIYVRDYSWSKQIKGTTP